MAKRILIISATVVGVFLAGCGGTTPSTQELGSFSTLGPRPVVAPPHLQQAVTVSGPYRVVPGDLLSLNMPTVVQALTPDAPTIQDIKPIQCRVAESGTIDLPNISPLNVGGKTLTEVELMVVKAYCPKFVRERPLVVAQVVEYKTNKVSILGGVEKPGVYDLRSDEMSLAAAIMKAGGILEQGSSVVRVQAPGQKDLVLPVNDQNVPAVNMALKGGETVTVDRLSPEYFTVTGLVAKGGTYQYPPGKTYNLAQALCFAGGLDNEAEPDYLRIVRKDSTNQSHTIVVNVASAELTKATDIEIHPGDMIYVEQTPATRTRQFIRSFFGHMGANGGYALAK